MLRHDVEFGRPSPVKERWHKRLERLVITDKGWANIFTIYHKSGLEAKFIWFQIRLIQNILGTNKRMNMIWPEEYPTPLCTFCEKEEENILHLFTECEEVNSIWTQLEEWLQGKGYESLKITRLVRLFGIITSEAREPNNVCILITRFFIWYCRCNKTSPTFQAALKYLRFYLKAIKISYYMEGNESKYNDVWANYADWIEENEIS